ncbi:MAG: helix-turn-helix domain-containing protein [Pseudonocardia sp.]|nr:MAG: helix-turn-helix domain-containing protein [Pseudonocardia sp.]
MNVVDLNRYPPPARLSVWRRAATELIHPMRIHTEESGPFTGTITQRTVCGLDTIRVRGRASSVERTSREIDSSLPGYLHLTYVVAGGIVVEQGDHGSRLGAGDFAWYRGNAPYRIETREPFELVHFLISDRYTNLIQESIGETTSMVRRDARLYGMLDAFISGLSRIDTLPDQPANGSLELPLIQIIATLRNSDAPIRVENENLVSGVKFLACAKRYISEHLNKTDLNSTCIADACHVSVRYLYKLFAADGTTINEYVRNERLEAVMRDLHDPEIAYKSIRDLSLNRGFVSPAHFSRVFKDKYGMPPADFRARIRPGLINHR